MMRIALFLLTNLAVMVVFGLVLSLTGIQSSSMTGLLIMALLFGFGGSIVSLMMSKWMALKSVGGEVIEQPRNETERWLMNTVAQQAQQVDQDSIATTRLDENTVQEFGQLSRSVNRMLDGLAQSFELQRQFAGNAAHELRTPLAILQTKLELFAEEHPAMDAETAGLIRSLREQLDRLTALVRTLLEMSNLQSVSRTDQIALAPLVEEILTDLTPLAQKNNISLQQDCEELGMVGSDALIYRLVFNLVENGIKYNRPGGAVRVTLQQEKQTAVLRVADTGPGIPADCRESIFQPFFRVDKSRSREMGGVGLGLALVREIAVLHGGSVTVERSSENGTTFAVTLPLAQPC